MYKIEGYSYSNNQNDLLDLATLEEVVEHLVKWNEKTVVDDGDIHVSYYDDIRDLYQNIFRAGAGEPILQKRENILQYLKMYHQIEKWEAHNRSYPDLDPNYFVDYFQVFPCFTYAPKTIIEKLQEIPIQQIYGDNWAFEPKGKRGNYPRYAKLHDLLSGYTEVENQGWGRKESDIPPVQLYKIGDGYFLSEGNHRLYLSILLNRPTLLAEIVEVEYESFLNHSTIEYIGEQPCFVYHRQVLPIDDTQAKFYQMVKDLYHAHNRLDMKEVLQQLKRM